MKVFTEIILNTLDYIKTTLNLDKTILSAVFLAIGNTIGDLFSNIAIAKKG